ncbi:MAG: RnfH family protein [Pseudomonadota bacterium]|jgi:putative ubiquitin-RnfH superfamily antitoxin RatB of RatAB toxin-antitoxin module|nr:RnfH family protein [Xanthomonadaceae bacterium]MDE2249433.1 RnfH family protein [Xanthomonadaceae bacterium]MDE3209252.1 RnfH family protein [Pseudomonadota bacterium]
MVEERLSVEVVHAQGGQAVRRTVELPAGSTVRQAIEASGLGALLPGGCFDSALFGIYSRRVDADHLLQDGDRVEIYRPLLIDPMEARRRRAS